MGQRLVPMTVSVLHAGFNRFVVGMLVMRIMLVLLFVLHCFMTMLMKMPLGETEPHPQAHQ